MIPVVDILQSLTMAHATAGEAHELRMKVGNDLRQVLTQAILSPLERLLRKERHHVYAYTCYF